MDEAATAVVTLLGRIAEHSGPPAKLSELCRSIGMTESAAEIATPMVLAMLRVFGVLRTTQPAPSDESHVAPVSQEAGYFLRSLAAYIRADHSILGNWERPGTADPPFTSRQVLSGPQFVHLIEEQRLALDPDAPPLRSVEVVQVVVKSRLRGRGSKAQYLVQYDERARQYQLPGGHVRASDPDRRAAAIRELEEELPGYIYSPTSDLLRELGTFSIKQLSRTSGAVTGYQVTLYQLTSDNREIPSGPGGRWVPEDVVLDKAALADRVSLNVTALARLDQALPGGLYALPLSLTGIQHSSVREVMKERRWELLGVLIGVVGILVSLIPLLG